MSAAGLASGLHQEGLTVSMLPPCPQCDSPVVQATELSLVETGIHARLGCNRCYHHWSLHLAIAGPDQCVVPASVLAQTLDVLRPYVRLTNGKPRARNQAWEISHRIVELMALPAVAQFSLTKNPAR